MIQGGVGYNFYSRRDLFTAGGLLYGGGSVQRVWLMLFAWADNTCGVLTTVAELAATCGYADHIVKADLYRLANKSLLTYVNDKGDLKIRLSMFYKSLPNSPVSPPLFPPEP